MGQERFTPFLDPRESEEHSGSLDGLIALDNLVEPSYFDNESYEADKRTNAAVIEAAGAIHRSLPPELQDHIWISGGIAINHWTHYSFLMQGLKPMSRLRMTDDVDFYIPYGRFYRFRKELQNHWEVIRMWEEHHHMALTVHIDGRDIRIDFTSFQDDFVGPKEPELPQFTTYPASLLFDAVPTIWPPDAFDPRREKVPIGDVDMRIMSPTGLAVLKTMFTRQGQRYRFKDARDIIHLMRAQPNIMKELTEASHTSRYCLDTMRRIIELMLRLDDAGTVL